MAAVPISVVLGSPLSSALLEMDGIAGLKGWQWMFILEAIPAFPPRLRRPLLHDGPAGKGDSGSTMTSVSGWSTP